MMDPIGSLDPQRIAEYLVEQLGRETECFASGALIVYNHRGQVVLSCVRPVDHWFLQALQRRLLLSYQLCAGPALAEPEVGVTIRGIPVTGPYEPPRSLLTSPLLAGGRVTGMLAVASVFPDAFRSQDLCVMSVLAAQVSEVLAHVRATASGSDSGPANSRLRQESAQSGARPVSCPAGSPRQLSLSGFPDAAASPPAGKQDAYELGRCLDAILQLAERWKRQVEIGLSDPLRQDLDKIALNASRVRDLLVEHG